MEHSEALFAQLEAVREAGGVNMSDSVAVRNQAVKMELDDLTATLTAMFTKPMFERSRDYSDLLTKFGEWRESENEAETTSVGDEPGELGVVDASPAGILAGADEPTSGVVESEPAPIPEKTASAEDETPTPGGSAPSDGEPEKSPK